MIAVFIEHLDEDLSDQRQKDKLMDALKEGAELFFTKPFNAQEVITYLLVQIYFRWNHFDENIIIAENRVIETVVQVRKFADGIINLVAALMP